MWRSLAKLLTGKYYASQLEAWSAVAPSLAVIAFIIAIVFFILTGLINGTLFPVYLRNMNLHGFLTSQLHTFISIYR